MILRYFAFLLFVSLFASCGDTGTSADAATEATASTTPSALPSIGIPRLEHLWNNATYMDATFYDLPISINQSEIEQIRATIATVGSEPMAIPAGAKPIGHIWFQINGKNVEEADIFYQEDCVAYLWYENGQPAYSNQMTKDGVLFYDNIFKSVPPQN